MLLLQLRSGSETPRQKVITDFPFTIGRSAAANLLLQSPGVWDRHLTIGLDPGTRRFSFKSQPGAVVFQNRDRAEEGFIANGDLFQLGNSEIVITLAPASQHPLHIPEWTTWGVLILVVLVEVALFLFLQRDLPSASRNSRTASGATISIPGH